MGISHPCHQAGHRDQMIKDKSRLKSITEILEKDKSQLVPGDNNNLNSQIQFQNLVSAHMLGGGSKEGCSQWQEGKCGDLSWFERQASAKEENS